MFPSSVLQQFSKSTIVRKHILVNLIIGGFLMLLSFLAMLSSEKSTHLGGGVVVVGESFFDFSAESLALFIRESETDE